ncbi:MAG: LysM peptidoglycan-binding domain-containing protein [Pseudomonadota bacterium]
MILRHFKTRFGIVLGGALVALNLSCSSSNEQLEDPVSTVDAAQPNLEEGSLSDANVDESFSASMDSAAATPGPSASEQPAPEKTVAEQSSVAETPVAEQLTVEPSVSGQTMTEPSQELSVDSALAQNIPALEAAKTDGYQGAEGFSADSATKSPETASPETETSSAEASGPAVSSEVASEQPVSAPSAKQSEALKKSGNSFVYTVKKGDWLSKVALKVYGPEGSWQDISERNGLKDANRIQPGQKLILEVKNEASKKFAKAYGNIVFQKVTDYPSVQPNGVATIFAQPGDSLSKLAALIYGSQGSWKSLYAMNQKSVADADLIYVKQKITFKAEFPKDTSFEDSSAH